MKKLIVILLGLMMISCGGMYKYVGGSKVRHKNTMEIPIYLDGEFSKSEEAEIKRAIEEWNYVLNGNGRIYIAERFYSREYMIKELRPRVEVAGDGTIVVKMREDDPNHPGDRVSAGTLAFVMSGGLDLVVLTDRIGSRSLKVAIMHELGHVMGLDHIFIRESLLYYSYRGMRIDCIDKITSYQVAERHGWDVETMRYCRTPNFR